MRNDGTDDRRARRLPREVGAEIVNEGSSFCQPAAK